MLPRFDYLIIETYQQLAAVVLAVAVAITAARITWVKLGRARAPTARPHKPAALRKPVQPHTVAGAAAGAEFERLASMITEATDRAEHISETQSAAALKLDSAEMAVNRLVAEIGTVMTVPNPAHVSAAQKGTPTETPRSNLAA